METRQPITPPDHETGDGRKQEVGAFQTVSATRSYEEQRSVPVQFGQSGYSLPQGYGETRILSMVRDPEWIFAYWEIASQTREDFETRYGPASWVNSRPALKVHDLTSDPTGNAFFFIDINDQANNWYIHAGKGGCTYKVSLGRFISGEFKVLAVSNSVHTPPGRPSDVEDVNWGTVEQIQRISRWVRPGLSSPEMVRAVSARMEEYAASPGLMAPGSPVPEERPAGEAFWLCVDCELILYGRTVPGSTVSVAGKRIPVREDGSFSIRYNLPDGTIALPVEAVSADARNVRVITPVINRHTH